MALRASPASFTCRWCQLWWVFNSFCVFPSDASFAERGFTVQASASSGDAKPFNRTGRKMQSIRETHTYTDAFLCEYWSVLGGMAPAKILSRISGICDTESDREFRGASSSCRVRDTIFGNQQADNGSGQTLCRECNSQTTALESQMFPCLVAS